MNNNDLCQCGREAVWFLHGLDKQGVCEECEHDGWRDSFGRVWDSVDLLAHRYILHPKASEPVKFWTGGYLGNGFRITRHIRLYNLLKGQ